MLERHDTERRRAVAEEPVRTPEQLANRHLLALGTQAIRPFLAALEDTRRMIRTQARQTGLATTRRLLALEQTLFRFEGSVTLIGQVKAGKTALVNALCGHPGLLPSDVNPWTSVVTSLHVNGHPPARTRAQFRFFDDTEWDALVRGGGRLGELAGRAGAEDDLEKLRQQVAGMRAKAQERLSRNFEALLGKTHSYGYVDRELIERYVCVGDPDDLAADPQLAQGRFSDITRSADIWLDLPELGAPLLLRDTPGVNDTFLVREQITLKALRGSQVCVAVLSAHEALNTTDLALVRLISSYESRQVILFVNRIDELAQPSTQVPEIRASIQHTLAALRLPTEGCILFGSALWAEMALTGDLSDLDRNADARAAFDDWSRQPGLPADEDAATRLWRMSGLPDLQDAIYRRIVSHSGRRHLQSIMTEMKNIRSEYDARQALAARRRLAGNIARADPMALRAAIGAIGTRATDRMEETIALLSADLRRSLDGVKDHFVNAATDDLVDHLRRYPGDHRWTYNSAGLRMMFWSAHDLFARQAHAGIGSILAETAGQLSQLYPQALGLAPDGFRIEPPLVPPVPAPVSLGRTIAVDLGSSWWSRWFQRRREIRTHARDYRLLIDAEITSMIEDLEQTHLAEIFSSARAVLGGFLRDQQRMALDLLVNASAHQAEDRDSDTFPLVLEASLAALQGLRFPGAPETPFSQGRRQTEGEPA